LPPKERQQAGSESSGSDRETLLTGGKTGRSTGPSKRKKYVQDLPTDAVQTSHQLQDGDVIVLATDGFWDNVFTKEALELVDRELGDIIRESHYHGAEISSDDLMARVQALSKRLTNTARRFSTDATRLTPFSQGARHLRTGG
jgi:protein phosphatase PTC7